MAANGGLSEFPKNRRLLQKGSRLEGVLQKLCNKKKTHGNCGNDLLNINHQSGAMSDDVRDKQDVSESLTDKDMQDAFASVDSTGRNGSSRRKQHKTYKVVRPTNYKEMNDEQMRSLSLFTDISSDESGEPPPMLDDMVAVTTSFPHNLDSPIVEYFSDCCIVDSESDTKVQYVADISNINQRVPDCLVIPEGTVIVRPEPAVIDSTSLLLSDSACIEAWMLRKDKRFAANLTEVINCTACSRQLGTGYSSDVFRHPALKVLICRNCFNKLKRFVSGAESSGEQCRWCAKEDDLIWCNFCRSAFCKSCIRRNFGRKELHTIIDADQQVKWDCYLCDSRPLVPLVNRCTSVIESLMKQEQKLAVAEQKKIASAKNIGKKCSSSTVNSGSNSAQSATVSLLLSNNLSTRSAEYILSKTSGAAQPVFVTLDDNGNDVNRQLQESLLSNLSEVSVAADTPMIIRSATSQLSGDEASASISSNSLLDCQPSCSSPSVGSDQRCEQDLVSTVSHLLCVTDTMVFLLRTFEKQLNNICADYATAQYTTAVRSTYVHRRRMIGSQIWLTYVKYCNTWQDVAVKGGLLLEGEPGNQAPLAAMRPKPYPTYLVTNSHSNSVVPGLVPLSVASASGASPHIYRSASSTFFPRYRSIVSRSLSTAVTPVHVYSSSSHSPGYSDFQPSLPVLNYLQIGHPTSTQFLSRVSMSDLSASYAPHLVNTPATVTSERITPDSEKCNPYKQGGGDAFIILSDSDESDGEHVTD